MEWDVKWKETKRTKGKQNQEKEAGECILKMRIFKDIMRLKRLRNVQVFKDQKRVLFEKKSNLYI